MPPWPTKGKQKGSKREAKGKQKGSKWEAKGKQKGKHTPILGVIENMSGLQLKGTVKTADGFAQKDLRMVFQGIDKEVTTDEEGNFSFPIDLFKSGGGAEESERLGVPLLGKIPISMEIMSATDRGKPIILSDPQSTVSEIFRDIAVNILSQLAN